ncbi:E3 ubiquitin-protein ligase ZSWIM2-like isoform X2 [Oscarella lobularis]
MSRRYPWRRLSPDVVADRIEQALSKRIYLVHQKGPTGFILKEEQCERKHKVYLGDPHSCTCSTFIQERELCIHILWVILKKFRMPKENPLVYQRCMVEREINELVYGRNLRMAKRPAVEERVQDDAGGDEVKQKELTGNDVCPICQDELLESSEPITYCKRGCGKSVHIKCMKVWADHQKSTGELIIRCPLCREDFGPLEILRNEFHRSTTSRKSLATERNDVHLHISCHSCHVSPIIGKCYRCSVCRTLYLCHACFARRIHEEHSFEYKTKPLHRWRPALRSSGQALPAAVLTDLQTRELTTEDYDVLLQLDDSLSDGTGCLPPHVVKSFPVERIKRGSALLSPGVHCSVCLQSFNLLQYVRILPCRHRFHQRCIDRWLTQDRGTCPVDGQAVPAVIYARKLKPKQTRKDTALPPLTNSKHLVGSSAGLQLVGNSFGRTTLSSSPFGQDVRRDVVMRRNDHRKRAPV